MNLAKILIFAGLGLAVLGVLVLVAGKLGVRLFSLPGDVVWRGKNTTVYFPIVTSIVLSVLLTLNPFVLQPALVRVRESDLFF